MSTILGLLPALKRPNLALLAIINIALAHSRAYGQIKRWDRASCSNFGPSYVGPVANLTVFEPNEPSRIEDVASFYSCTMNERYLNAAVHGFYDNGLDMVIDPGEMPHRLASGVDFIGVNY